MALTFYTIHVCEQIHNAPSYSTFCTIIYLYNESNAVLNQYLVFVHKSVYFCISRIRDWSCQEACGVYYGNFCTTNANQLVFWNIYHLHYEGQTVFACYIFHIGEAFANIFLCHHASHHNQPYLPSRMDFPPYVLKIALSLLYVHLKDVFLTSIESMNVPFVRGGSDT